MIELVRPLGHVLQTTEVLLRLGHLDAAHAALAALADLYPDLTALHMFRGWYWLMQDQPKQAAVAFRLATGRDPIDPLAWHGLAAASLDEIERQNAIKQQQLLSADGPHAQLWHDLETNKPHLAITPLHQLAQRFPEYPSLTLWLAETQRRLDNVDQARTTLEPLLRRRPRSIPALFLAAALSDDRMEIQQFLFDALRNDPLGTSAQRLFAPERLPFALPSEPVVRLSHDLAQVFDDLATVAPQARRQPRIQRSPVRAVVAKAADAAPVAPTAVIDRDTNDVLSAVEHAAQQLFNRTPLARDTDTATAILATHRGALEASYGRPTTNAIIERLGAYGAALSSRSIHAEVVVLDDPQILSKFGNVVPSTEPSAAAHKQVIDAVRTHLVAQDQDVDAIVLIGGDSIIPFHRLTNPSQDADPDVPSDNPYGCGAGSELAPELIVARFPDGGADGGQLLMDQLDRAIEYHQNWHFAGPQGGVLKLPFMRRFAKAQTRGPVASWAASAAAWQLPSAAVFEELESSRPLLLCPPADPAMLAAAWPSDSRVLYFNVHGIQGGPHWYGQAIDEDGDTPLPVALTPADIGAISPASICLSEACFGAEISGRTPDNAIALRMLQRGTLSFVGSTVTAYGAVTLPLGGADLLTQQVFQHLRRGYPLGRAVVQARDWLAREMVQRQGYLDPDDAKTLLSFVLLGDPWTTPYTRPSLERKTALPQITPVVVQRRPVAPNLIAPATVDIARQMIAKVAPKLARAPLAASGQGRPDRIAKGQASAVVFSASEPITTVDGRTLAQIARVTVSGNEARKILLSR